MNHWGRVFTINIMGESHGEGVGVVIDGCPAGIPLNKDDFLVDLERRKPGAKGTTQRIESDIPRIITGIYKEKTTGSPLTIWFDNKNTKSKDYSILLNHPRPGHADFVARKKFYNYNDYRGGGHFSGRLTLALVAAGVIAKKIIPEVSVKSDIYSIKGKKEYKPIIDEALSKKDSVGGIVKCEAKNIPIGWGEPFFDSIESMISHLAFSIPAIKGISFGSGFEAAEMWGSEHNDLLLNKKGETKTNHSGGISGGITNGNTLEFKVAVKPTSSISSIQKTINIESNTIEELKIEGRHDACIALRVPVVVEAITAIALADFKLIRNTQEKNHL